MAAAVGELDPDGHGGARTMVRTEASVRSTGRPRAASDAAGVVGVVGAHAEPDEPPDAVRLQRQRHRRTEPLACEGRRAKRAVS